MTGRASFNPCGPLALSSRDGKAYKSAGRLAGSGWPGPRSAGDPVYPWVAHKQRVETSSSANAGSAGNAWNVNFDNGNSNANDTGNTNRVRCVR